MTYVPLAVRSEYSFYDGMCRVESLVERAKALRLEAVGIADLHSALGLVPFYVAAKQMRLRPILGVRVQLLDDAPGGHPWGNSRPELVLQARDEHGFHNLLKIVSLANLERGDETAGITLTDLERFSSGLLVLDGGTKGPIAQAFLQGNAREALRTANQLKAMLGKENFFIQIERQSSNHKSQFEPYLLHLARERNIPVVAVTETRYLEPEDAEAHAVLRCLGEGITLQEAERAGVSTGRHHLRSDVEIRRIYADLPEALSNTRLIAESCQVDLDLDHQALPDCRPESGREPQEELQLQCERGACNKYATARYQDVPVAVRDRIAHELAIIEEKKLASCFLVVQDVVRYAKEEGIPVGPGRGSAAGSLVAHALGITEVDPLQHGLFFERFLLSKQKTLPDLDLEVGHRWRHQIVEYVRQRFGRDRVTHLMQLSRLSGKTLLREAGRALGYPSNEIEGLLKSLRSNNAEIPSYAMQRRHKTRRRKLENPSLPRLLEVCCRLEGLPYHASLQAGGLLFFPDARANHVALQRTCSGEVMAQATSRIAEHLGLMQLHVAGSRHLSIQHDAEKLVRERKQADFRIQHIPQDDESTYRMIAHGGALSVFQLEGSMMHEIVSKLTPSRFSHLVASLALNQMSAHLAIAPEQLLDSQGLAQSALLNCEAGAQVLQESYGVFLYEEQLMAIATSIAGYDLEEANELRGVILRRDLSEMTRQRTRFLSAALENGHAPDDAEKIFASLMAFSSAGISKAHNVASAMVAYRGAYTLTHHAMEYTVALLNNCLGQGKRLQKVLAEAIERQVSILDVDINRSDALYRIEDSAIRIGLSHVKSVGEKRAHQIVCDRNENGPFLSVDDFCARLSQLPRGVVSALIEVGAFSSLGEGRRRLGEVVPLVGRGRHRKVTRDEKASQLTLALGDGRSELELAEGAEEPTEKLSAASYTGSGVAARRAAPRPSLSGRSRPMPEVSRLWVVGQIRARR